MEVMPIPKCSQCHQMTLRVTALPRAYLGNNCYLLEVLVTF